MLELMHAIEQSKLFLKRKIAIKMKSLPSTGKKAKCQFHEKEIKKNISMQYEGKILYVYIKFKSNKEIFEEGHFIVIKLAMIATNKCVSCFRQRIPSK